MQIIDDDLAQSQFADLDAQTTAMLVAAVEQDFTTWTDRLAHAAGAADGDATRRARHALSGLCGAFGATDLMQACTGPLASQSDRQALLAVNIATIAAIRLAATTVSARL
jgi:hypothetical protein